MNSMAHDPLTPVNCSACRHYCEFKGVSYCRETRRELAYSPNRLIMCKHYGKKQD